MTGLRTVFAASTRHVAGERRSANSDMGADVTIWTRRGAAIGVSQKLLLIIDGVVERRLRRDGKLPGHRVKSELLQYEKKESASMTIVNRFNIGLVAAGAGLCGVAIALSANAAAVPFLTGGGYACVDTSAGAVGAAPAAGAPAAAGAAGAAGAPLCTASAPVADMAGIPLALPGPAPVAPAPVPLAAPAPLPLGAPVPVVPVAAPVGAPIVDMAGGMGGMGGKGDPIQPPAPGAPVSGQPILPGPTG